MSERLDTLEASATALIETLADLQDRSTSALDRASDISASLDLSGSVASSLGPSTPRSRCHPHGSSASASVVVVPGNSSSPCLGDEGSVVVAIIYTGVPGNAPEDQRRGIRVVVGSPGRRNPVDECTVARLEEMAAALPSDDDTLTRYLFFDYDSTLPTTEEGVPWRSPAVETLRCFDEPAAEPAPAAAAAKPSWRRRHRLAAVLRKFRQHDRVFVVTSNPAIGEIAGLLNLLMDTEASVGLGFVAGDSVVLVRSGPKCDAVRAILASRGLAVHSGLGPATARQDAKVSPTPAGAAHFNRTGTAGDSPPELTDCGIDGLSLYEELVTPEHQARLLDFTEQALAAGRRGELAGKTFTQPSALWAQLNKSREMLQYGVYTNSNRVQHTVEVLPLPPVLEDLIDLLVANAVFPTAARPDTCVINVYSAGMWLPPHVDSDIFARPFCTVSLLSDQHAVFGDEITGDDGEFEGEVRVKMARGSVLRLDRHAAGPICLHAIPKVTERRISITLRRLSEVSKAAFAADERERLARKRRRWTAKKEAKLAAKRN